MHCPKCGKNSLEKTALEHPSVCFGCGGVWVRPAEVSGLPRLAAALTVPTVESVEADRQAGFCPDGHGLLSRARVAGNPDFFLEKCSRCGGIWFDGGELERVAAAGLLTELTDLWTAAWQVRQRQAQLRRNELEQAEGQLGEPLFSQVMALAEALKGHPARSFAMALLQRESGEG